MQPRNVTTIDPMLQDPSVPLGPTPIDPHEPPSRPRRPRWLIFLAILAVVCALGYVVGQRYTSHLFALAPGTAPPVKDFITIRPPGQVHDHKGRILLVTVSLRTVQPLDYIQDKLNPDIQIVSEHALLGTAKASQLTQANQVAMQNSSQTAVVVALERLGYKINVAGQGAEVDEVEANSPADGHLQPGDVITAIDGAPTATNDALVSAIRRHKAGDTVRLTVQSTTGSRTVTRTETLRLALSPPGQDGSRHAFIGIQTTTKGNAQLPFGVTIDAGNIGGPSAGLAFTLGVIDELTKTDLTGGQVIAATGTIGSDGAVGDVGGVAQKTAAVRDAGAVAFLVPPGEYQEALKHAGSHLKIIQVKSIEQALDALRSLGGDLSALGPPPATTG
jgi:PDZ domain-containing protein